MEKDPADPESPRLLILGASVRAAAMSATRAGFQPICADLFADVDLREIAPVDCVADYPRGLVAVAKKTAPGDWMYVGALENHPNVVGEISARHRLLGNGPDVLRAVRDPIRVTGFLRTNGFPVLEVRAEDDPPVDGDWLRKPLKSAAGHGICLWSLSSARPPSGSPATHYYQRLGAGVSISAMFVASPQRVELVGVTQQLIGIPEWNAPAFGYCGSIGPLALPATVHSQIEHMGSALAREFELRGLFGLDLLWAGTEVRFLEVNPRYTSSVEVLEWATGRLLIAEHAAACGRAEPRAAVSAWIPQSKQRFVGKAIVFAGRETANGAFPSRILGNELPAVADIPAAGTVIGPGEPICTVFSDGATFVGCRGELDFRVHDVLRRVSG